MKLAVVMSFINSALSLDLARGSTVHFILILSVGSIGVIYPSLRLSTALSSLSFSYSIKINKTYMGLVCSPHLGATNGTGGSNLH